MAHCRWRPAGVAAVLLAGISAAACGSSHPAGRSTSTSAPATGASSTTGANPDALSLTLTDSVQNGAAVTCPGGTPSSAQCYLLSESGRSPQLGAVTVAPVVDIEYPDGQPQCNAPRTFSEDLTTAAGTLTVSVTGPYLCLGDESTTDRTFTISSGTGRYSGATGSGTIAFTTLADGATEAWTGMLHPGG